MAVEKAGSIPIGLVVALLLIAAWVLHKLAKEAHGDVELGVPTVTGDSVISGSDVYYSRRGPSVELDPSNPAVDERMRQLIWESNRAIAIDDADEEAAELAAEGY